MRSIESAPPTVVDEIVTAKLVRLIDHASASGWWRNYLGSAIASRAGELDLRSLVAEVPILSRQALQENIHWMRIWLPDSKLDDYAEISTSGSTGAPVHVLRYLPSYLPRYSASELLDVEWSRRDLTKHIGYFRIGPQKVQRSPMPAPLSYVGGTGTVIFQNLLESTPRELLEIAAREELSYLSVNGMVQRLLAIEQIIDPVPGLRLEQLLNWADPVSAELRELVHQAFGARIVDRYTSNEFGYLAIQCPAANHLHAPQIYNFIEILDEQDNPVEPGQLGRVIVTSLDGVAQPLIRYELGDFASWSDEECPAGITFPIFSPGIVRQRDIRISNSGKILIPHPDSLEIIKSGRVGKYQILEFEDVVVLLVEERLELPADEILASEEKLSTQFGGLKPAKVMSVSSADANALPIWKPKRIVTVEGVAPAPLEPRALTKLISEGRI